jgi:hypothetical protein
MVVPDKAVPPAQHNSQRKTSDNSKKKGIPVTKLKQSILIT